jgi:hypothetical protein
MSRRSQRLVSGKPPKASQRRNARKLSAKVRKAAAMTTRRKTKESVITDSPVRTVADETCRSHPACAPPLMAYSPSAATPGARPTTSRAHGPPLWRRRGYARNGAIGCFQSQP